MKKILSFLLFCLSASFIYAEGIRSAKDLLEFANACNSGQSIDVWKNASGEVCLVSDIDMAKVKKFSGIRSFEGVFDGCGYSILNWKASKGLFGEIRHGATVKNLKIDRSCTMKSVSKNDLYAVGFIADINSGVVANCENHGSVFHKSGYTENDVYVGGIVGMNRFVVMRCRNFAGFEVQAISVAQKGEISIHVGGIAGGSALNPESFPLVVWCENVGNIEYTGDFPVCDVGGITGCGYRMPVKFCVNKGSLIVNTVQGELANPSFLPQAHVGGVVGLTKGDVMCCDNFGNIKSSGSHSPMVGGVCGVPHSFIVVGDCVNYASVKVSNDRSGYTGGIVGSINRPVHVKRCINRGDVEYSGFSPERRSATGGIVGSVSVKKDAMYGGYVRDCANYGNIMSGPGGNKYGNNDNALHTGGIAGWMSGSHRAVVKLKNCSNFGKVTSDGGRCGNISGACVNVQTGGEYVPEAAEAAQPLSDGSNIFGRVTTTTGTPVAGIIISDGRQSVETDGYGYYAMKSDMREVDFVQISFPAECEITASDGRPAYYKRVPRYQKAVMANFVLTPRLSVNDKFTLLMIADPQMRPFGYDNSAETYQSSVIPDAETLRSALKEECYAINLGDLVYNYMPAYDDYLDITKGLECPVFNVLGNHDYDQTTMFDSSIGTMYFETYVGPANYSFNIGKIHFIVLNDIVYNRKSSSDIYVSGIEDKTFEWLKGDLAFVPDSMTIAVCAHSQLFKKKNSHSTKNLNYDGYKSLFLKYEKVYSWAGHNHENYHYDYSGKNLGMDNVSCVTVSRSTGALRLNKYLNHDGTPQGYVVASVNGNDMDWYYKSVGRDRSYQMRVYPPNRTDGLKVVANIWTYGDGWSEVEWWENGVEVAKMKNVEMYDPDYLELYSSVMDETTKKYCKPVKSTNMFEVIPTENVRSGEVRVKDKFGNVYISKIQW